ncbi:MAG: hypothetical protein LBP87_00370, partial [Planctomycetaceae bacterium]|nr:hypothetical protein [Planctomycetaceae bacterium]
DQDLVHKLSWSGTIPYQKWQKFYTTVLTRLNAGNNNIEISLQFKITSEKGITQQQINEVESAMREFGIEGIIKKE